MIQERLLILLCNLPTTLLECPGTHFKWGRGGQGLGSRSGSRSSALRATAAHAKVGHSGTVSAEPGTQLRDEAQTVVLSASEHLPPSSPSRPSPGSRCPGTDREQKAGSAQASAPSRRSRSSSTQGYFCEF